MCELACHTLCHRVHQAPHALHLSDEQLRQGSLEGSVAMAGTWQLKVFSEVRLDDEAGCTWVGVCDMRRKVVGNGSEQIGQSKKRLLGKEFILTI